MTKDAVFEIAADQAIVCSIDGGPPAPCTSPWRPAIAADGRHTFVVSSGRVSQAGSFTLDRTGPEIVFTAGPAQAAHSVTYALTVSEGTPECTWDGAPVVCGATLDGEHSLVVRAADALGNVTEVARRVTVAQPQVTQVDTSPAPAPDGGVLSTTAAQPSVRVVTAKRTRAWTTLKSVVVRDAPKGTTIKATCKGRGCPRTLKASAGRIAGLSGRRLRPGAVITIRLTGAVERTFSIRINATRAPRVT